MSKTQDVFGTAPKTVLNKPLLHVQDQKASGTSGGSSSNASYHDRDLNTTLINEITGASLSSNEVTLPAGTYYVEATAPAIRSNGSFLTVAKSDNTQLLRGTYAFTDESATTGGGNTATVNGRVVLTETTTIKLRHWTKAGFADSGLGAAAGVSGDNEVFTDIRIWQLDAAIKTPILINDKLFPLPGGVIVTGNMHGLEYSYVDASNISVQPGICMDSVNETVLQLSTAQNVLIPSVADTVYNLFLTDDAETVKVDTDVDGANLPAQDKRRWIGFVTTDGSGNIFQFVQVGDRLEYAFDVVLQNPLASSLTRYALVDGQHAPLGRLNTTIFNMTGSHSGSAALVVNKDVDGVQGEQIRYAAIPANWGQQYSYETRDTALWGRMSVGTGRLLIEGFTIKR